MAEARVVRPDRRQLRWDMVDLEGRLPQSVTALIGEGLTRFSEIAVDGTKIRASASKKSFKTGEKLLKIEAVVVERLAASSRN